MCESPMTDIIGWVELIIPLGGFGFWNYLWYDSCCSEVLSRATSVCSNSKVVPCQMDFEGGCSCEYQAETSITFVKTIVLKKTCQLADNGAASGRSVECHPAILSTTYIQYSIHPSTCTVWQVPACADSSAAACNPSQPPWQFMNQHLAAQRNNKWSISSVVTSIPAYAGEERHHHTHKIGGDISAR